jgi:hypothetical protein
MIDAELRSITTLLTGLETFSVYDITRVDMVYKNIGDIRDHFELPHIMQFIREDMLTKDGFFIEHAKPPRYISSSLRSGQFLQRDICQDFRTDIGHRESDRMD